VQLYFERNVIAFTARWLQEIVSDLYCFRPVASSNPDFPKSKEAVEKLFELQASSFSPVGR